ncbi:Uncharacterised protein [Corynebacterium ulcerans]|uniref:YcxB-like protein domain-containing protein n=2 Tax=Corynebacterium ulcerans TaxID=65058 RepID=A0ABM5U315_CORUL|nr:Hypothetical protein CulFRC58_1967 [Corynebacterium ulcerans FRC58]SQG55834.1 Uncharacterised protein [Corynebacterium ulcerans]
MLLAGFILYRDRIISCTPAFQIRMIAASVFTYKKKDFNLVMDKKIKNKMKDRGVASVGGYTSVAIVVFSTISLSATLWALFGTSRNYASPIIVAFIFGVLGLAFALLGVRWHVYDGYLKVTQWGITRKIHIADISSFSSESEMKWKQGVGIRWVGPGEWAMVCGAHEVVTISYCEKKFFFSADNALEIEQAIYRETLGSEHDQFC